MKEINKERKKERKKEKRKENPGKTKHFSYIGSKSTFLKLGHNWRNTLIAISDKKVKSQLICTATFFALHNFQKYAVASFILQLQAKLLLTCGTYKSSTIWIECKTATEVPGDESGRYSVNG